MQFKSLPHEQMVSLLKSHDLCINCIRPGHFLKQCKSLHRCQKCQRPHHTLLHRESSSNKSEAQPSLLVNSVVSNAATGIKSNCLLMTCHVLIDAHDGSSVEARAIVDSASSASFVSERISQSLCPPRSHQNARTPGVAGLYHSSPFQAIAILTISSVMTPTRKFKVTVVVVPKVTCDLSLHPVTFDLSWKHLMNIPLADPDFGRPARIDLLLGVELFVLHQGRLTGLPQLSRLNLAGTSQVRRNPSLLIKTLLHIIPPYGCWRLAPTKILGSRRKIKESLELLSLGAVSCKTFP